MKFEPGVIGVDEVGRGAWAGPLCAAAVIFFQDPYETNRRIIIRDSKKMSEQQRESTYAIIRKSALIIKEFVPLETIDLKGVNNANKFAFRRVIEKIKQNIKKNHILGSEAYSEGFFKVHADGREICSFSIPYTYMVRGEEKSLAIAAASIVAKVTRDRFMKRMAQQYPGYGFEQHKGYGTRQHHDALQRLGLCEIHRRSFRPIREMLYALNYETHPMVPPWRGIRPPSPTRRYRRCGVS